MTQQNDGGLPERSDGAGDGELSGRLERLDQAIKRREAAPGAHRGSRPISSSDAQGFARAFRLSSEFIAGVVVGGGLGWFVDRWFGSTPWGLIVFLLLGFAAGVLNVMRAAGISRHPGSSDRPDA